MIYLHTLPTGFQDIQANRTYTALPVEEGLPILRGDPILGKVTPRGP